MKGQYDQEAVERSFNVGDKVLVLLSVTGHPLQDRYHSPYEVVRKPAS